MYSVPENERLTLYCLPCAGGSASMYYRWKSKMAANIYVVPLELPGRGRKIGEPFIHRFEDLVTYLAKQLIVMINKASSQNYALFGHSMGSLLAYGIARYMQENRQQLPKNLFLSASAAPSCRDTGRFAQLQTDDELITDLHKQGGTPSAVFDSVELLRMTLDTLAADYSVCASFNYVSAATLPCPIDVFAGEDDEVTLSELQAWDKETGADYALHWFAGGHFYLWQQEEGLLAKIGELLTAEAASSNC